MDDTGAGGQPSRAEFEALRRKVEAIDDFAVRAERRDPDQAALALLSSGVRLLSRRPGLPDLVPGADRV